MQKFLIISDIHDNLAVLAQKESSQNLAGLIIAGDICAWETVKHIQKLFSVPTWLVADKSDYDWPPPQSKKFVIASEAKQSLSTNSNNSNSEFKTQNSKLLHYYMRPFIFQINNFTIGLAHEPE